MKISRKIKALLIIVVAFLAIVVFFIEFLKQEEGRARNYYLSKDLMQIVIAKIEDNFPHESQDYRPRFKVPDISFVDYEKKHCAHNSSALCIILFIEQRDELFSAELGKVFTFLSDPCATIKKDVLLDDVNNHWDIVFNSFNCRLNPKKATSINYILKPEPAIVAHFN